MFSSDEAEIVQWQISLPRIFTLFNYSLQYKKRGKGIFYRMQSREFRSNFYRVIVLQAVHGV